MPLANDPLLQATPVAKIQSVAPSTAVQPAEFGKDDAFSFSQVYAKQADPKPTVSTEPRANVVKDKPDVVASKPNAEPKTAADKTTVADNGKSLPADKTDKTDKTSKKADGSDKDDDDDASADDQATSSTVADASVVTPAVDPSLTQAQPVQPAPDPAPPVATVPPPTTDVPPTVLAAVTPPPASTSTADTKAFDPASDDPLAGLSAVQVALEQNGKGANPAASTQASTSGTTGATSTTAANSNTNTNTDPSQLAVNNLAVPVDPQSTDSNSAGSGDKAFKNLIDDGLKDSTVAATDTKVDDFASRIAALSEAAQPKAVAAPAVSPLAQPLAMHQSGWSEGVVDRVMYLSSQNLKSADIQLEPAELGRLDIRVNMAPDQQTQITFMSSHPAVRDALEGQMNKLRDSFAQQGMGQVDVNVSDQSRGWNGQGQNQQQQQANQSQGTGGTSGVGSGSGDGLDNGAITDVAQAAQPMKIIGTSQVDYYA